jgi:Mn-dependent DtxR family transcriptional regulator
MRVLTELEKTILLAFLILDRDKFFSEAELISKFPIRQRKTVGRYIKKLEKAKLLEKHPKQASYILTKEGTKQALKLLYEGAKLWTMMK